MMKHTAAIFGGLLAATLAAETKVKLENLPPAVQAAVKEQTKDAKLVGLSKEVEGGKTMYEVETAVNGKSRDLMLDSTGAVITTEEEVDLDTIPAAAKSAILKKVAGGKLKKVETVKEKSGTSYEAAFVSKAGKNAEFAVNSDGSAHK